MRKYLKSLFSLKDHLTSFRDNRCHEHVIVRFVSAYVISAFPREDVCVHRTSLTPPRFIEVPVPSQ